MTGLSARIEHLHLTDTRESVCSDQRYPQASGTGGNVVRVHIRGLNDTAEAGRAKSPTGGAETKNG